MPIFGNSKSVNNSKRINWWSDGSTQIKTKNVIYEGDLVSTKSSNMMWTKNGTVTHSGNQFWGPDGMYTKNGNVVHGPKGQVWNGVNSDDDVFGIISHNLK